MYNTSNEFLIESTEINLLVTEGLADKSKKAFTNIIKKIKEFIRKVLMYIKSKLSNKIKAVDKNIKTAKVNETETETIEEPITLANTKKLNDILNSVEMVLKTSKKITFRPDVDLDELLNTATKDYETLESVYEKYKDNIDETYTKITPNMFDIYGEINKKCSAILDSISQNTRVLESDIKLLNDLAYSFSPKIVQVLTKAQAIITKVMTVVEFVINSCNRSITKLYH